MTLLKFSDETPDGLLFTFSRAYPLSVDAVSVYCNALGVVQVSSEKNTAIILSSPNRLNSVDWIKKIQGVSFENPFPSVDDWQERFPAFAELLARCTKTSRQATHADVLKLKLARDLRWLNLRYGDVGDSAMPFLSGMESLESLCLASTTVTDEGVEILTRNHPKLIELNLRSTSITDESVKLIADRLQQLQVLDIGDTRVTSAARGFLESLPELRLLNE